MSLDFEDKAIADALRELRIKKPHELQVEFIKRFFEHAHRTEKGYTVRMFAKNGELYIAKGEPYEKRQLLLHTLTILEDRGLVKVIICKGRKYIFMPLDVAEVFLKHLAT